MVRRLDSVHKAFFDFVEDNNAEEKEDQHENKAIQQVKPVKDAGAHKAVFEGFDNAGHGVQQQHPLFIGRDGLQGVNNGGNVHPELYPKLQQEGQVAVFGGKGRKNNPKTQTEAGHHHDQQGQQPGCGIGGQRCSGQQKIDIHPDKQGKLDKKTHQVGDDNGDRHHQAGEIYLPKYVLVFDKDFGIPRQAVRKVIP